MDTPTLRTAIKKVINHYAKLKPSHGDIRLDTVFDETSDRYVLMQVGWSRGQRVRGNLIYITLENNKVYLEYDGIEQGITQDLIEQGIPSESIILAFLPETQVPLAV
jgi:XisI protein